MKKKGLIIATIVMVLVLAVSLTTATYAWFTTTSSSSVTNINVSVAAGSDVNIGLTTTGSHVQSATEANFVSGTCNWNDTTANAWAGDEGLSSSVDTGLSLSAIQLAVGTASKNVAGGVAAADVDAANAQLTSEYFIKANESTAQGHATGAIGTIQDAVENSDYLHFTLGLQPSLQTIDTITLNMTIAATDTKKIMGMTAALHVMFKVDGEANWHNIDLGGAGTYNTTKATARTLTDTNTTYSGYACTKTAYNTDTTLGTICGTSDALAATTIAAGSSNIAITLGTTNTAMYQNSVYPIHQIEIYIYYVGADSDAVGAAVIGSSCTTYFTITDTEISGS